ncbi:MAG: 50S ribosomal protein L32 [Elusimicrobiota bacterium]
MANPKRRQTRHRTMSRRNKNWSLKVEATSSCSNCGAARPGHTVCPSCGFYNGKLVIAKKDKKSKSAKGKETKEEDS